MESVKSDLAKARVPSTKRSFVASLAKGAAPSEASGKAFLALRKNLSQEVMATNAVNVSIPLVLVKRKLADLAMAGLGEWG